MLTTAPSGYNRQTGPPGLRGQPPGERDGGGASRSGGGRGLVLPPTRGAHPEMRDRTVVAPTSARAVPAAGLRRLGCHERRHHGSAHVGTRQTVLEEPGERRHGDRSLISQKGAGICWAETAKEMMGAWLS